MGFWKPRDDSSIPRPFRRRYVDIIRGLPPPELRNLISELTLHRAATIFCDAYFTIALAQTRDRLDT